MYAKKNNLNTVRELYYKMSLLVNIMPALPFGLCWQLSLLATLNLMSEKKGMQMLFNDSTWTFKSKLGWRDYFDSLELSDNNADGVKVTIDLSLYDSVGEYNPFKHRFKLKCYREMFSKLVVLNKELTDLMSQIMAANNLVPGEYDSILIRRGDKILCDSYIKPTVLYIEHLLAQNPKTIFLQTDDYNSYLEMKEIIKYNNLDIKLVCICPPWQRGVVTQKNVFTDLKNGIVNQYMQNDNNKTYINNWLKTNNKTTEEFSPTEMREHVECAIVGMEICIQSRYLVLDFGSSNISRYLYIRHNNIENVISTDGIYPWGEDTEICIPSPNFC